MTHQMSFKQLRKKNIRQKTQIDDLSKSNYNKLLVAIIL